MPNIRALTRNFPMSMTFQDDRGGWPEGVLHLAKSSGHVVLIPDVSAPFFVDVAHRNFGKTSLAHHLVAPQVGVDAVSARKLAAMLRAASLAGLRSTRRAAAARSR